MNQDGKTPGLNTPSSEAQAALSLRVYQEAGLNPADTSFVEAHGTVSFPASHKKNQSNKRTGNTSRRPRRDSVDIQSLLRGLW
jgi:hypothetical protein